MPAISKGRGGVQLIGTIATVVSGQPADFPVHAVGTLFSVQGGAKHGAVAALEGHSTRLLKCGDDVRLRHLKSVADHQMSQCGRRHASEHGHDGADQDLLYNGEAALTA